MKVEAAAFLFLAGAAPAQWEKLPPLPEPNGGFACGALGGRVVVIGGTNWKDDTKRWLDGIWVFDPDSGAWRESGKLPHPLAYAVSAEWQGGLLIAGGTDGVRPRREVWHLRPSLEMVRVGDLDEGVALAAGGVIGESLFVLGGCADVAKLDGLRRGGQRFDLAKKLVSALAPAGEVGFGSAAGAVAGTEWLVFAGARHDPVRAVANLGACWGFDPGRGSWRVLRPYPFAVRGAAAVALDGNHVLVAGGYGGEPEDFTARAFVYEVAADRFRAAPDLPVAAAVGLARVGEHVYCLGGEDRKKHRTDAVFRMAWRRLLSGSGGGR